MKDIAWDRHSCITQIRDRIWSYVSPASQPEIPGLLAAAALLNWPANEALRLGEIQFVLSNEVRDLLAFMPQLVQRLTTTSARQEQRSPERLAGPVVWSQTHSTRGITGNPIDYVTAPAERVYQTAENELLVHVLDAIVRTARSIGWSGDTGKNAAAGDVQKRLRLAENWKSHPILKSVSPVEPTTRSVSRINSGRAHNRYAIVIAAYTQLVALVEQVDRSAIREAIEQAGLVTSQDSTLFELLATFQIIDTLQDSGWVMEPFYIFEGSVQSRGIREDGRRIRIWYQSRPDQFASASAYKRTLSQHNFRYIQDLRPDLILQWESHGGTTRRLLVECKQTRKDKLSTIAREAVADLLAYRYSFDSVLATTGRPYGLGIAWGEGLVPALDSEIVLCTPDYLVSALAQIVS